jgi:hypothetical protein
MKELELLRTLSAEHFEWDARGETQMMDQELIDARIDSAFQILDRTMQESDDYEKIKDL